MRHCIFVLLVFQLTSCTGNTGSKDLMPLEGKEVRDAGHKVVVIDSTKINKVSSFFLLGKFNPKTDTAFAVVPSKYCSREGMYLQKETIAAFIRMHEAAKKEGITLRIISATRNFNEQKTIWEAKWNGSRLVNGKNLATAVKDPVERAKTILRYSSMPGTSRHHWGTDMDINSLENSYFATAEGKKMYDWMKKNASQFGFCQPYSAKNETRPNGYEEEKWHWSYTPLSSVLLENYLNDIKTTDITGFSGSETAGKLNIIEEYVKGINPGCR